MDRFSDLRVLRWADRIQATLDGRQQGPIRANLDLTNLCQDQCFFCEPIAFRAETIKDNRHTLPYEVALQVMDDLAQLNCKTVNFSGGGEPLIHPDFGRLLVRAEFLGMRTWIVTNGGFIHKWVPELLNAHHVRISLDASNEAEHMAMHGSKPGEFDKVINNISTLCKSRTAKSPEVGIAYIVADCNFSHENIYTTLLRINDIIKATGVDFIHFRPLSEEKPQAFTGDWEFKVKMIEQFWAEKKPAAQCFPLGKRLKDVFFQREFDKCYAAMTLAVIGANGDVSACCDERGIVFGNVHKKRFADIWLDAEHRAKALAIEPKLCSRCLMCGFNRAVQKYVVENHALPELI